MFRLWLSSGHLMDEGVEPLVSEPSVKKSEDVSQEHSFLSSEIPAKSFVIQWHVTEACNLHCRHCYQETPASPERSFDDLLLILEQIKELLERVRAEKAPHPFHAHINVTGGEPFVRRDFMDFLEILASNKEHFSFGILTNGILIDEAMARRLGALSPRNVQVSIEGSVSTNDAIRGRGVFDDTVRGLEALNRENISTVISFTAHKGNFTEFQEVARIGRDLGVSRVWADRLIPCGSGSEMRDGSLTPEETRAFFEIMYAARSEAESGFCRTEISMRRALQFLTGGGTPYRCAAGERLLTVQANGDLYPCRRLPIKVGNLMETSMVDLYYTSDLLQALRRHRTSEGCDTCRFSDQCRGGLRCLAYAVTGDPFKPDPGCWRVTPRAQK